MCRIVCVDNWYVNFVRHRTRSYKHKFTTQQTTTFYLHYKLFIYLARAQKKRPELLYSADEFGNIIYIYKIYLYWFTYILIGYFFYCRNMFCQILKVYNTILKHFFMFTHKEMYWKMDMFRYKIFFLSSLHWIYTILLYRCVKYNMMNPLILINFRIQVQKILGAAAKNSTTYF